MFHACEDIANYKAMTDAPGARKLGRASYIVATVGIVVTIVLLVIYISVKNQSVENSLHSLKTTSTTPSTSCYDGVCYRHKSYMSYADCSSVDGLYYYGQHGGVCFYN